jgi:hypothetical protein
MDLLRTAVIDIATLVATSRALRTSRLEGEPAEHGKFRSRLRGDLRRGTAAYIDALARSKRAEMDEQLLDACRSAAEKQMPRATRYREELKLLMSSQPGVLDGVAVVRQDLWRLAHMSVHLRLGLAAMRDAGDPAEFEAAKKLANRLRRRIRRALITYARVSHREKEGEEPLLTVARKAAVKQIEQHVEAEAQRLGEMEDRGRPSSAVIRKGVEKPLHDLVLDWPRPMGIQP